nr:hypothetical protein [Rickettsia asembonensis]
MLVFFIVFMDLVSKPRGDTVGFTDPRNKAFPRRRESRKKSLNTDKINLKKRVFYRFYWIPAFS